MSDILSTTRVLLKMGIATIPVPFMQKAPVIPWKKYQQELPSPDDLVHWFGNGHRSNYAVITGWQGLTVLDFDDLEEYTRWLFWTGNASDETKIVGKSTYRVQSSRGVHVYVRLSEAIKSRKVGQHIDILSQNKIVIGAGSVHPSGAIYTAIRPMLIMCVNTLSDILPVDMLTGDTELPVHVVKPAYVPASTPVLDPWQAAANPATKCDTHTVERIKKAHRIEDMFSDKIPTGSKYVMTHCPLHDDEHHSMWIDTEKQICGCFACMFDLPLDYVNLFAKIYSISNREAIEILARSL